MARLAALLRAAALLSTSARAQVEGRERAAASGPSSQLPFMIDQAASTISASDAQGFSADRLRGYGVVQAAAGSIDCTSYMSGVPGGPWYNASGLRMVAEAITEARGIIAAGKAAGLQVYLSSDLFQFPALFLDRYGENLTSPGVSCIGYRRSPLCISIASPFTRSAYVALFDELLATFPDIDGLVLRYGENSPCADHEGNAPYDSTNASTAVSSLTALLLFLREELAVARNLTVIFRTWDTSTAMLHANASFYAAVTDPVPPHPKLVFSIKHTMLDFWRRVRFNPTLGGGAHRQVVEGEVGGMYGGCGTWPLYIGKYLIESYPEDAAIGEPRGLTWLATSAPPGTFAGVLLNHQCTSTPAARDPFLWWRLEEAVIAGWAANTSTSEAALFDDHVRNEWGVTDATARGALRNLTLTAMEANLAMQTCAASDTQWPENDRPTSNWLLWDGVGGLEQLAGTSCHAYNVTHCETFPWLFNNSKLDVALEEKAWAAATYAALNASVWADVLPHIPNATFATALAASLEAGVRFSSLISTGWMVMALGYTGDRTGVYNATALTEAIDSYDAQREAYLAFPSTYPPHLAPGLMNDTYWEHPTSGQGGLLASVDKYRNMTGGASRGATAPTTCGLGGDTGR